MERGDALYRQFLNILQEELRPAMGCTEPIALAYAGAKARQLLGALPDRVTVYVSGNIIKNVKSVRVPNIGALHGIGPAVCAGIVAGDPDKELEVISQVSEDQVQALETYLQTTPVEIHPAESPLAFDIDLRISRGPDSVRLRIVNNHTNVAYMERNGEILLSRPITEASEDQLTDKSCLNIQRIVEFADILEPEDVRPCVGRQIAYNMAIAEEGLRGDWGANIGRVLLNHQGSLLCKRAAAYAAAGSDARMSGCNLPVVILSGSGNQGITASVPVVVYARALGKDEDALLRAVALSDLVTVHQKTGIGRLSAYCGAISAGCGAGAGIIYLRGGGADAVAHTVVNAIAILSGTICDGAKPSCAAKIAAAVDAGILGCDMYLEHQQFCCGDGIVTDCADKTVSNVGRLAREGMRETEKTILEIMLDEA
ncbi:MAG: L-serine ammonia-lyase, iron-sulfur-dependent, subunit alpha [Firmicutes bacterium]|nr:L-serine ammonia-lyase, iron-sulfur-dependent, subunit alpha [Bacillota bacterium]